MIGIMVHGANTASVNTLTLQLGKTANKCYEVTLYQSLKELKYSQMLPIF